jgi:hypothetical protein
MGVRAGVFECICQALRSNAEHMFRGRQRTFNRTLVLWAHIALGMLVSMIYLSRMNLTGFRYYTRGAGTGALFLAAPALLPYVISALYFRTFKCNRRVRVLVFLSMRANKSALCCSCAGVCSIDRFFDARKCQYWIEARAFASAYSNSLVATA